jgi:type IX secretion system PorP/SprF family membrane protein
MIKKLLYICCFLSVFLTEGKSQDVHFTSFEFSPLTLNPALAGSFSGSYRLGGIYRDQWRSVAGSGAYSTPTLHVDIPLIRGLRKQDWVGIGVGFFSDKSGSYSNKEDGSRNNPLVYTKSFQGLSYHLALDKKQTRIISFGIQNGTGSRKLKQGTTLLTESFIVEGNSQDDLLISNGSGSIIDWVGGVTFSAHMRNLSFLRTGLSVGRINRKSQSFAGSTDRQKLKYTIFGMYDTPISGNLFLTPSLLYQRTGNNQELVLQTKVSKLLSEEKEIYGNFGLGYRVGDAIQLLVGADIKNIKVQLAYDMNVSGLVGASRTVGGFELAVSYIGKVYKKPKIDPTKICPRL